MRYNVQITRELLPGGVYVRNTVFVEEQGFQNELDETDNIAWHLLISDGDKPVAAARLFTEDGGVTYHLGRMAVLKEYRGRHLGAMAMDVLEEKTRALGGMLITLSAQCRASGFYEKVGYAQTDDFHLDEGCPHVTMEKYLAGKPKYRLAVFDLDGTILDTLDDLADSLNAVLAQNGYPQRTRDEVRRFVGNGIRTLILRALPEGTDDAEIDRIFGIFKDYYQQHCAEKTAPYEGIPMLLRILRAAGMRSAVLSNKADAAVQALCAQYFKGLLAAARGERAPFPRKPEPDSLLDLLRELEVSAADAVYIGDSEVDVATARNAGMHAVLVDWGFRDRETLLAAGAQVIVSDTDALLRELME